MKALALALAVIFFIVGLAYAMGWLQLFTSEASPHHVKHAIVFWVLAFLGLIWYRFQSNTPAR